METGNSPNYSPQQSVWRQYEHRPTSQWPAQWWPEGRRPPCRPYQYLLEVNGIGQQLLKLHIDGHLDLSTQLTFLFKNICEFADLTFEFIIGDRAVVKRLTSFPGETEQGEENWVRNFLIEWICQADLCVIFKGSNEILLSSKRHPKDRPFKADRNG